MKLRNKKTGDIIIKHIAITVDNEYRKTYSSLAELNDEWEDVPAEPLIKDEKIRRAVRCLGITKVCFVSPSGLTWRAYDYEFNGAFELIIKTKPFDECKDGNVYYITDLCGEEDE